MDAKHLPFLDELASAFDAGDREATYLIPTFRPWLEELLTDPVAQRLEPGSVGHTARMFALRLAAEAAA